jgi:hypothetical protein
VVGGGLGVEDLDVGREGGVLGAVDSKLGPVLGVAPGTGAGAFELDRGLPVRFVKREGRLDLAKHLSCERVATDGKPKRIADLEANRRV